MREFLAIPCHQASMVYILLPKSTTLEAWHVYVVLLGECPRRTTDQDWHFLVVLLGKCPISSTNEDSRVHVVLLGHLSNSTIMRS